MSNDNKHYIKNSRHNRIESLGVIMTITQAIALSGCNKTESDMTIIHLTKGLQIGILGSDISLPGNDFLPPCYVNEINAKLLLALFKDKSYDCVLSKTNSGRADRRTLAFYVPNVSIAPQDNTDHLDTAPSVQLSTPRAKTLIQAIHLPTDYDGMTSLNKIAERRISGAAAICAESEPRHPIPIPYSVTPTQKQIGGIHA